LVQRNRRPFREIPKRSRSLGDRKPDEVQRIQLFEKRGYEYSSKDPTRKGDTISKKII